MVFGGCGWGPISRVSPPPFLPNAVKNNPRRGWGTIMAGNRTVTHCLGSSVWFPPFRRGKCCSFFSFCVFCVRIGVFCRFLSFFSSKGRFLEKFSGANFCFWMLVSVLFFWWLFAYVFCFIFRGSLPKLFGKNSLNVRSGSFWGRSLSVWFFRRRRRRRSSFFFF